MVIVNYTELDIKCLGILENWSGKQLGHSSQMKEQINCQTRKMAQQWQAPAALLAEGLGWLASTHMEPYNLLLLHLQIRCSLHGPYTHVVLIHPCEKAPYK